MLKPCDWDDAFYAIADKLSTTSASDIAAVAGGLVDAEALVALKDLMNKVGTESVCTEEVFPTAGAGSDLRHNYLLNSGIASVEDADLVILVGTNPRFEAPLFNTRLRKSMINNELRIAVLGTQVDLTYEYDYLGDSANVLEELLQGTHAYNKLIAKAKNPMIVVGSGALQRADNSALFSLTSRLAQKVSEQSGAPADWRVFNVLHRAASQVGALDIGYKAGVEAVRAQKPKVLYMLGADEGNLSRSDLPKDAFVIYQGHHGDVGAEMADVVLPGAAYTEKNATYVNTEGRSQLTQLAVAPPGKAKEDWQILRALSEVIGSPLPYNELHEVRARMTEVSPTLTQYNVLEPANFIKANIELTQASTAKLSSEPLKAFQTELSQFYMTNPVARASSTMAKCVKSFEQKKNQQKQAASAAN